MVCVMSKRVNKNAFMSIVVFDMVMSAVILGVLYFLNGQQSVIIMDELDGRVLNSIETEHILLFHIDKVNNRLFLVDEDVLKTYSLFGNILNEIKLINFPDFEMAHFSLDNKMNNLHLFDEENFWLSFKENKFSI